MRDKSVVKNFCFLAKQVMPHKNTLTVSFLRNLMFSDRDSSTSFRIVKKYKS